LPYCTVDHHCIPEINKGRVPYFGIKKQITMVKTQGYRQPQATRLIDEPGRERDEGGHEICNGLAMEGLGRSCRRFGDGEVRPINVGVSAGRSKGFV
jgi:hypothetical protein